MNIYYQLNILDRSTTVTCTSEDGLLFVVPKFHYQTIIQENKIKFCSNEQNQNNYSGANDNNRDGFIVKQNFTQYQNIRNLQAGNETGQIIDNSDNQGPQTNLIMSKISPKAQFTKLQINQMQNNSKAITSFSKTNKQIQDIFNQKMQNFSQNISNNSLFQSNLLNKNNLNEDNEQSSSKQDQIEFKFCHTNHQDILSNNNSKYISSNEQDCEVQDQNTSSIKSSQFRVRKYQSDRSITIPIQTHNNEINQFQNKKILLQQEELCGQFFNTGNLKKSEGESQQEMMFRNKSTSSGNKFGLSNGFKFQMNINGEQNNASTQQNPSNPQKFNFKNLKETISTSIEIIPSASQRSFQNIMKASITPSANSMRRRLFQDQSPNEIFKKRGIVGFSLGSSRNNQSDGNNVFCSINKTQDKYNYPASDVVEGDTQKNAGSTQQQTFSTAAAQHKLNSIVSFSKKTVLFDSTPKLNFQENILSPTSKILFRKKNATAFTASCKDIQALKNIDADEITKCIQANINSQVKFSAKNSSSAFISNNLDKSSLSSQQNIFSAKSTAAPLTTKVQLSTSNQSSPKKNFIVKKSQKFISSNQGSTNNISSFHNLVNNEGNITNKQQEQTNTETNSFVESDESFIMYEDYTTQMINTQQFGVQASNDTKIDMMESNQIQIKESDPLKNEACLNQNSVTSSSRQTKTKKVIPLLDLKSLGNDNSQINNFFGNINNINTNNNNNTGIGQVKSLSQSQISLQTSKQQESIIQLNQEQKKENKLQRQQSLNLRPQTPSVKKLDLTNLNEQIKKQTQINQQNDVGFNELAQQRLILPSFNTPQIQSFNNQTKQQNKYDFFSPSKKLYEENKTPESNIFSIPSQSSNQLLNFFQNNKSKQPNQNLNCLYQGLIKNQNYKEKTSQVIISKNNMSIQDQL